MISVPVAEYAPCARCQESKRGMFRPFMISMIGFEILEMSTQCIDLSRPFQGWPLEELPCSRNTLWKWHPVNDELLYRGASQYTRPGRGIKISIGHQHPADEMRNHLGRRHFSPDWRRVRLQLVEPVYQLPARLRVPEGFLHSQDQDNAASFGAWPRVQARPSF